MKSHNLLARPSVVLLLLSPSCFTRNKAAGNKWPHEISRSHYSLGGLFTVIFRRAKRT